MDIPYSTCNAKGRCLRHPTIQLSRKKKLGGWKTILSICPMCAMEIMKGGGDPNDYIHGLQKVDNDINHEEEEVQRNELAHRHSNNSGECSRERRGNGHSDTMSLHSHDRPTHRSSSRGGIGNSSSHQHRRPPSSYSSSRHHANQRYTTSSDDRSTHSAGHSIHSAPSTFHFHRRDSQESGSSRGSSSFANKGGGFHNSSDSSCDTHTTVYSSDSSRRSQHSSSTSRHSHGGQQEQHGQRQRRPMGVPMRGHHDNIKPIPQATTTHVVRPQHNMVQQEEDEDEYVCGMPYQGMKYTGQINSIHAESQSRVPHGLGTLRSNDGMIWEGTWHFGRLLDNDSRGQDDMDELCDKFDQHTTIQDVHATVSNSDDCSVSNYSIAETIHGEYSSNVNTKDEESSSTTSSKQVMHSKMDEYSRYITHCDETQDYYYTEDEEDEDEDDSDVSSISRYSNSSSSSIITQQQYHQHGQNRHGVRWNENLIENGQRRLRQTNSSGSRRVRFCEDP